MRSVSYPFYRTAAWKHCREAYMHKVHGLCEICAKSGIVKPADIVHHKKHLSDDNVHDPEIALNFDNLQAVCIDCHNALHFRKTAKKRWKIVDGELTIEDDAPPDQPVIR